MERPRSTLVGWLDEDAHLHCEGKAVVVRPGGLFFREAAARGAPSGLHRGFDALRRATARRSGPSRVGPGPCLKSGGRGG